MKMLNKYGIPQQIFNALSKLDDWYGGAGEERDFSVTQLLNPPKQSILIARHHHEIETDACDNIWMLLGSAVHLLIETGNKNDENLLLEKRYKINLDGKIISGGVDCFNIQKNEISDYKVVKTSSYIYKGNYEKYKLQLNMYRYIMYVYGYKNINSLKIIEIFKDFDKRKCSPDNINYPVCPVHEITLPIMPYSEIESYMKTKIKALISANQVIDEDKIPPCSEEERWQRGKTRYAIMEYGKSRAVKLCDDMRSANEELAKKPSVYYIQERSPEPIRCTSYCSVNKFCNFYKQYLAKEKESLTNGSNSSTTKSATSISKLFE